ncbi:MAG: low-specificity L-threonine aldolase [Gammaproteobacteria bacterium]|nr:low-specificity L-threonine aldolase [Gammaproteobacteria bacterium]
MTVIDLRSDTVTRPGQRMLDAMCAAELGDDVYGDDPTVNRFEELAAETFATEAAVLAPTGTQTNLIALLAHCQRGDEYIVGGDAHTYKYEGGGAAVLGGIQPQTLPFDEQGVLPLDQVKKLIKEDDTHFARTRLLALENTQHGRVVPLAYLQQARQFTRENGLTLHLDGARVMNAAVKLGVPVADITRQVDSVSVCLSKGLGAPVGSVLCGTAAFVAEARKWRKMVGGGMRQAGLIAATGIVALEENVQRLAEDHANAEHLATALESIDEIEINRNWLETNMVWATVPRAVTEQLASHAAAQGVKLSINREGRCRMVTHLDVSRQDVEKAAEVIGDFFRP